MFDQVEIIRKVIKQFCREFIENPYLCYTEHGQHALFYKMLCDAIGVKHLYTEWKNQKVCVVQKEYPTAGKLDKSRRQHWDIAVFKTPLKGSGYDYLSLAAAIEFGLNANETHLDDDIERLCNPDANTENRFIVHLYRISEAGAKFSRRDLSSSSKQEPLEKKAIARKTEGNPVEIYYASYSNINEGKITKDACLMKNGEVKDL